MPSFKRCCSILSKISRGLSAPFELLHQLRDVLINQIYRLLLLIIYSAIKLKQCETNEHS